VSDFPPLGPTTVQKVIPAYLYVQYNDDPNLQGLFDGFNAYAQGYVDWFNALNLPVYTNPNITGALLDWVATHLYGLPRPGLPAVGTPPMGEFNTYQYNRLMFNQSIGGVVPPYIATSDDTYKRVLTWLFYKGDGRVFTIKWLKRRVTRFLYGVNGIDPGLDNTDTVSVTFTNPRAATITIPASAAAADIFVAAVEAGVLELPFQNSWTIVTA
jgi:hypothetical protein